MAGAASPFGHEKSELIQQLEAAADERIAPNAKDVDKNSRFPQEALDVMRELKILSSSLPTELGGLGLKLRELSEIASTIARRCGASSMVFAMHEAQVECMRFGSVGDPHFEAILRDCAENQLLIASITSEAGIGGNIRASQTVAAADADRVVFEKQSPTLSYAEYADAFLTTARRSEDAAQSDQVLVYSSKEETELEKLGVWDMMGLRGTCSPPFKVNVDVPAANLINVPFGIISTHRMVPWSHILWASCWEGIATSAYDKAAHATRKKAKKQMAAGEALGDPRLADAYSTLQALRALIYEFARVFEEQAEVAPDAKSAEETKVLIADAMALKLNASMMSSKVAEQCLEIIGMPGYSEGAPSSVSREVRDLMGARMMVSNDRLRRAGGEILLMGAEV
ncbi:MAG: acyl-CoA/acyl-ACP dehydrogenase [Thermoleophilaceae bacterium]|nr:acyl-CoA/acyl-ACP dehydrogenase [Thermoleophilaceae bacterium]